MSTKREELLSRLVLVGRQYSDASVFFHAAMARRLGLHLTDYKTLGVLERAGPMSAGQIAEHTGLATASVTDLLDRLERKGFVRRVDDPADRRRVLAEAVPEKIAAAARSFAPVRRAWARLYEEYSERELEVIADFLARGAEVLRVETEKLE
jgi:DNA-binding MarR family transcriptional regulator